MSENQFKTPKYLTLNDLRAKLAGRSRSSIYSDLAAERIPRPFKLGGRLLWVEDEVDAHLGILRDSEKNYQKTFRED